MTPCIFSCTRTTTHIQILHVQLYKSHTCNYTHIQFHTYNSTRTTGVLHTYSAQSREERRRQQQESELRAAKRPAPDTDSDANPALKKRNARMFGALMGTLRKFKYESVAVVVAVGCPSLLRRRPCTWSKHCMHMSRVLVYDI